MGRVADRAERIAAPIVASRQPSDHLFVGTQQQNVADMDTKGRRGRGWHPIRRGEVHQAARLSDATVAEIRSAIASGEGQRRIASRFGISHTYVGKLGRREMRV